jgi:hypothetical protein
MRKAMDGINRSRVVDGLPPRSFIGQDSEKTVCRIGLKEALCEEVLEV